MLHRRLHPVSGTNDRPGAMNQSFSIGTGRREWIVLGNAAVKKQWIVLPVREWQQWVVPRGAG